MSTILDTEQTLVHTWIQSRLEYILGYRAGFSTYLDTEQALVYTWIQSRLEYIRGVSFSAFLDIEQ